MMCVIALAAVGIGLRVVSTYAAQRYSARVDHQIVVARSVHPCVARTIDVKKSAVNRDMWEQGANRKVLPP
jgi:hypothetical protein